MTHFELKRRNLGLMEVAIWGTSGKVVLILHRLGMSRVFV
ncbi:uncharacterized protein FTOL_02777 [Fusarium torulosum]|uniref:Uncharacterized protein n=1 Tax=Fusarium torulosum TaxID=33205 RepID=A0AAE8SEQ4_9HYPO|nr:uncharacterized protein FTOL_02777 [Fusarium torulosum]